MNITIASPNGIARSITISKEMEAHFNVPINHANTILKQINSGMYSKWFAGKKDMVVFDFGANVGLTSLYFVPACKELIMVEPTPSHYKLLRQLIPEAGAIKGCCQSALTATEGLFDFFTCNSSTENRITKAGKSEGEGTVIKTQGNPLSYYLSLTDDPVDFVKIDVEGGEMDALTINELKNAFDKVKMFYVEVHPTAGFTQEHNFNELIHRFQTTGYKTEKINFETFTAST